MSANLPTMTPPRPDAGSQIDWDKPVGYSHAATLLSLANDHTNRSTT